MASPIVLANPGVSETIVIRHRRGWRRIAEDWAVGRALRARRIDLAIDLHGGPRSSWLTFASRATMRVGYDVSGRGWMYTHVAPQPRGYAPRHSVLNQWDLLEIVDPAFRDRPDPEHDRLEMPADRAALGRVVERLSAEGVRDADKVIAVHVGAGNEFRQWPAASFGEVASELARGQHRAVVLVGAASDDRTIQEVARRARQGAGPDARVVAAAGWPLVELRALMDRASLFVGGDSGPMHVAATTDVPIVALFGPTLPVHWAPWRPAHIPFEAIEPGPLECRPCDQRVCAPGDFRCLRPTEPARVIAAAERFLAAAS